ncbi:MAG: CocE/NonD family hydrolase [Bacteroidales bacterium]|nr:CocE/NonD family hydrolase [Bacteroidales bacterium]
MKRLLYIVLMVITGLSAAGQAVPPAARPPASSNRSPDYGSLFTVPVKYGYTYHEEMVQGGSEARLMTRIYLPEGEGPWPVVVTRTPYVYGGQGDNNALGREYARRGIGYIQQDCRGKGGSEGFYSPNIYEREDGIALYNWLCAQPWCKSIGIFGSSYTALTGWLVADSVPGKLKGLYLSHYGVDRHISCFRSGLFREDIMSGWLIDNAEEEIIRPVRQEGQPVGENYYDFYLYRPQVEADLAVLGQRLDYYRDWITHTDYTDSYWNTGVWGDLKRIPSEVDVPVTIVAGQFDHHEEGTILGYERLRPEIRAKSRLILGSWNHSFQPTPNHVQMTHARDFNTTVDQFEWFYGLLVEEKEPVHEIRAYVIEDDRWVNLDEWPLRTKKEKVMYLSSQKASDQAYVLSGHRERKKSRLTYQYDPADPVYATGGETIFTTTGRRGSHLQPEMGSREDVLSFVTEPLESDLAIAGAVKVMLKVSTDVDDTCFAFTLSEVTPEGKAYNMRTSIATLGYRDGLLKPRVSYTPGEVVELEVEALPVLWNVKKGNRLRLDIKSSNFPEYAVHSNYAGVWAEQGRVRIARQNVFVGRRDGSRIIIPLLEN